MTESSVWVQDGVVVTVPAGTARCGGAGRCPMDESAVCEGAPAVDLPVGRVAEAVRVAVTRSSPEAALREVIDMAVESGPCDAASITVVDGDRPLTTLAWSDD